MGFGALHQQLEAGQRHRPLGAFSGRTGLTASGAEPLLEVPKVSGMEGEETVKWWKVIY